MHYWTKNFEQRFFEVCKKNIDLLRLNMSHLNIEDLKKSINTIKKYISTPICIDTEGAQIRTKILKEKFLSMKFEILVWKNTIKHFYLNFRWKHLISIPYFYLLRVFMINYFMMKKQKLPYCFGRN